MEERVIAFPFDTKKIVKEKVERIRNIVSDCNINTYDLNNSIVPVITVRCTDPQWEEIKFICALEKIYW